MKNRNNSYKKLSFITKISALTVKSHHYKVAVSFYYKIDILSIVFTVCYCLKKLKLINLKT